MDKEDLYIYLVFLAITWFVYYVIFYYIIRYTLYWDFSEYQITPSMNWNIFIMCFQFWYIPMIISIIIYVCYVRYC